MKYLLIILSNSFHSRNCLLNRTRKVLSFVVRANAFNYFPSGVLSRQIRSGNMFSHLVRCYCIITACIFVSEREGERISHRPCQK